MPNATVDPSHYERRELTSLPGTDTEEGGYVMVRPLPYGMKLQRRDKATRMYMEASPGTGKKAAQDATQKFELETMNEWATLFDMKYCIGEHNLTDVKGVPLDLGSPMTLQILDPKVGSEIERILTDLNEEEDEQSLEDFMKQHTLSTVEEPSTL